MDGDYKECDKCGQASDKTLKCSKCKSFSSVCAKCARNRLCSACDEPAGQQIKPSPSLSLSSPKIPSPKIPSSGSSSSSRTFSNISKPLTIDSGQLSDSPSSEEEVEEPPQKKLKVKVSKKKEKRLEDVAEVEHEFHLGKLNPQPKSAAVKKECLPKEAAPSLKPCCKTFNSFISKAEALSLERCASLQLGVMIRTVFSALEGEFGALTAKPDKQPDVLKCIAYDISFLWHNIFSNLSKCGKYKQDEDTPILIFGWQSERPKPHDVASCHPTAENLSNLLQIKPIQQKGQMGPKQSRLEEMRPHQKNCQALCRSLVESERGIWWITHCGHSFSLIKRECIGDIEIIDSFANNRGLGYWALTSEELGIVEPSIPKKGKENWNFHLPPQKRIWSTGEITPLLMQLVADDYEERYKAQKALVNYEYEMEPYEKSPEDRLPYGAFGFHQFALRPDEEIFLILAQKFFHAFKNWKAVPKQQKK